MGTGAFILISVAILMLGMIIGGIVMQNYKDTQIKNIIDNIPVPTTAPIVINTPTPVPTEFVNTTGENIQNNTDNGNTSNLSTNTDNSNLTNNTT